MPLFLTPFLVLAAGNTRVHKIQADAALMDVQTRRAEYELHLAEFNAAHHIQAHKTPAARATLVERHDLIRNGF